MEGKYLIVVISGGQVEMRTCVECCIMLSPSMIHELFVFISCFNLQNEPLKTKWVIIHGTILHNI